MKTNSKKSDYFLSTLKSKFAKIISSMAGSHISFAQELYFELKRTDADERHIALWAICELYGVVSPSNEANEVPVKDIAQIELLRKKISKSINCFYDKLIDKNFKPETFYKKASSYIFDERKLDNEPARILALCTLLLDARIPYFKYNEKDLCRMSEEDFHELINNLEEKRQLIRHFKSRNFPERTMQASAILNILGIKKPTEEEKESGTLTKYNEKVILMCELLYSTSN